MEMDSGEEHCRRCIALEVGALLTSSDPRGPKALELRAPLALALSFWLTKAIALTKILPVKVKGLTWG